MRILRLREVQKRLGISRTTLWHLRRRADFPKVIQVSAGVRGIREADFDAWIDARPDDNS